MMACSVGRRLLRVGALAALLVALLAAGCHRSGQPVEAKPAEVVVTSPITDDVIDYQDFTGRLEAVETVDIRARVSGYVTKAPFREGDVVRKGDLLFQIDPLPYQTDLNQAEANVKLAEAEHALQVKNAQRAAQLYARNAQSREDYETTLATRDKAAATVQSMKAARDRARLYLGYTHVTAPFTGRISRRLVDPANLVNADNTVLTTLVSEDPLYAYFDVDERTFLDLPRTNTQLAAASTVGLMASPGEMNRLLALAPLLAPQTLPVLMRLANEKDFQADEERQHRGTVNFVDNRVIATTGTVRMRGVFPNPQKLLKPGMFVRIRLPVGYPYKALLIPDEAILSDQGRKYVYIVNDRDEVEYRTVELGQSIQGLRVIKKGLAEGERIIIKGTQRVRPKARVVAQTEAPPQRPRSPWSQPLVSHNTATDRRTAGAK